MARGLRSGRTLAKEQNIGGDFRSRIGLEGGVRQPDRAQQVGMFGQMPADGVGLLVHGVAARDERHHAAGPQFLQRLGEEVIVNGPRELGLHRGVMDGVIAEGHVADNGIEVIVGQGRFLKALCEYRGIGIELLRDPGRDGIQFHAGPVAALHGFRHEAEEMAHAHGRLQYLRALAEAQTLQPAPDGLDHHAAT